MSSIPKTNKSMSEGFAWRVAGFFAEEDRPPTLEISPELDKMFDPEEYVPGIGESLIELGVMLLRYHQRALEDDEPEAPRRRPSPKPRAKPEVKQTKPEPEKDDAHTGLYL